MAARLPTTPNFMREDDDVMLASAREKRQPQWLQTLLHELRSRLRNAERECEEAKEAARTMSGKLDANSALVVAELPDGSRIGLPEDVQVTFLVPGGSPIAVYLDGGGVMLDALISTDLAVRPVSTQQMRVTVTRR